MKSVNALWAAALGVCLACPALADDTTYWLTFKFRTEETFSYSKIRIAVTDEVLSRNDINNTHLEYASGTTILEDSVVGTAKSTADGGPSRWFVYWSQEELDRFGSYAGMNFFVEFYELDESNTWYVSGYTETAWVSTGYNAFRDVTITSSIVSLILVTAPTRDGGSLVPEPSGGLLLLLGGGLIGLMRPRRRR